MFPPGMGMSEEEMPPEMKAMFEAQKKLEAKAAEFTRADRLFIHQFSAIFCSCQVSYDRDNPGQPPQAGCIVHGQMWIDPDDGKVL